MPYDVEKMREHTRKTVAKIGKSDEFISIALGKAAQKLMESGMPVTPDTLNAWLQEQRTAIRGPQGTADPTLHPMTGILDAFERWLSELEANAGRNS
jgi:hypothetical protein